VPIYFWGTKKAFMQSSDTIDYKELYEQSQKENFFLREEFKQLRAVNEQLVHRLEQLLKLSFGSKSERYGRKLYLKIWVLEYVKYVMRKEFLRKILLIPLGRISSLYRD